MSSQTPKITLLLKAKKTLSEPFESMGLSYTVEESNDSKNK